MAPGEIATAILDAGRGEIYIGEYGLNSGGLLLLSEYIAELDEFAGAACAVAGDLLTLDGTSRKTCEPRRSSVHLVARLHAGDIGRIGLRKCYEWKHCRSRDRRCQLHPAIRRRNIFIAEEEDVVLIRPATPDDVPAIRALEQQAETAAHWAEREYDALFAAGAPPRIALVAIAEAESCQSGRICNRASREPRVGN